MADHSVPLCFESKWFCFFWVFCFWFDGGAQWINLVQWFVKLSTTLQQFRCCVVWGDRLDWFCAYGGKQWATRIIAYWCFHTSQFNINTKESWSRNVKLTKIENTWAWSCTAWIWMRCDNQTVQEASPHKFNFAWMDLSMKSIQRLFDSILRWLPWVLSTAPMPIR